MRRERRGPKKSKRPGTPTFHHMAVCNSTGERIEDPEYVRGQPYGPVEAEVQRDYRETPELRKTLRRRKRAIRSFK